MKNFLRSIIIFTGIVCHFVTAQTVKLSAVYDAYNAAVKLNWNMVNSSSRTGYVLIKSTDGTIWTEAAKDRMQRYYTNEDVYIFNDRNFSQGRNYYRIRVSDENNNTVALSPIVIVNVGGTASTRTQTINKPQNNVQQQSQSRVQSNVKSYSTNNSDSWVIYPNPATDILKLAYRGSGDLKGIVNVQIQNAAGKVVIKFRSGSMYKNIEIPISNLVRGAYFIQVMVENELMMSRQFVKQ